MSRVDDAKEEQRIDEAKQLAKRLEQAQQAKTRHLFRAMVEKQQTNTHSKHQQQQAQQQQARGQTVLLTRRGILNNQTAGQLLQDSEQLLSASRQLRQQEAQGQTGKQLKSHQQELAAQQAPSPLAGTKSSEKDRNQDKQEQKDQQIGDKQAGAERLLQGASFGLPIHGVGASQNKTKGTSGASALHPSTQAIIDAIVDKIHRGVTANGMGLMEIALKDNVLHGAKLRILASKSGIQLGIFCENKEVNRMFGSQQTCQALTEKMADKGLVLQRLEINGQRIMG